MAHSKSIVRTHKEAIASESKRKTLISKTIKTIKSNYILFELSSYVVEWPMRLPKRHLSLELPWV